MLKIRSIALLTLFIVVFIFPAYAQIRIDEVVGRSSPKLNRSRGISMLEGVKETLEEFYYDKNYRGMNIDQRFKVAEEEIKKLDTNAQIFRVIGTLLLEFNDSHTRFYPPGRSNRIEYGFSMQMIGEHCMVVDVKRGSDAETKGLKIGDIITKIGQYPVTRDTLWVLNYYLYQLEPMQILPVFIRKPGNTEKGIGIEASFKSLQDRRKEADKLRKEKRENPYKCQKISHEVIACKLKTFSVDKKFIDQMMKEAVGSSKMILDLRGNRGGSIKIDEYLIGHFFDREVKIVDMVWRKKTESRVSTPVKDRKFQGELIVLIDSDSASASEVFARVIQLEKRGKVVGDVSAGAVMTSYQISMANRRGVDGFETLSFYGMNVTIADVIMSDGNRLENIGVIPDRAVGPTSEALILRSDPILAYAAELLGVKVTAEDAGKFEFLWKKLEIDDGEDDKNDDSDKPYD